MSSETCPHPGQVRLVLIAGTAISRPPFHASARAFKIARRRARHVVYLKVLDTHDRVVFADHGRGLVQIIPASVGDADVDTNDSRLRLLPVLAELLLWEGLRPAERGLVFCSEVHRRNHRRGSKRTTPMSMPTALLKWTGNFHVRWLDGLNHFSGPDILRFFTNEHLRSVARTHPYRGFSRTVAEPAEKLSRRPFIQTGCLRQVGSHPAMLQIHQHSTQPYRSAAESESCFQSTSTAHRSS